MFTIYELPVGDGSSKLYTNFYTHLRHSEFDAGALGATWKRKVQINVQTYRTPIGINQITSHLASDLEYVIKSYPKYAKRVVRVACGAIVAEGIAFGLLSLVQTGVLFLIGTECYFYIFRNPKRFDECIKMLEDDNYECIPTIHEELKDLDEVISGGKQDLEIRELVDKRMKKPIERLIGDSSIPEDVKRLYAIKIAENL